MPNANAIRHHAAQQLTDLIDAASPSDHSPTNLADVLPAVDAIAAYTLQCLVDSYQRHHYTTPVPMIVFAIQQLATKLNQIRP